ncbi:Tn3 family transposase [Microbispora sp. NPDC088329]|uniref:Tn3 family transposase n=1 Tax=Microbispora sp. NPDC088329 TaxID=3154869 RepID=UPI00341B6691
MGRLAERLGIDPDVLAECGQREQTRSDHLRLVAGYLGWKSAPAGSTAMKELEQFLLDRAMEHDSPTLLFNLATEYLMAAKTIRPGVTTLAKMVAAARTGATALTWEKVAHLLTDQLRADLDRLLVYDAGLKMTRLAWLIKAATDPSATSVKTAIDKLLYLRNMDAHTLDVSALAAERRRFLASVGRRSTNQALERREPQRRYPILLAVVTQSAVDQVDEVVMLFDQAVSARESRAKSKTDEALVERAKAGEARQLLLDVILPVLADTSIPDEQIGGLLRNTIGMSRLREVVSEGWKKLPRDHGRLSALHASYTYLRQFTPQVLAAIDFQGSTGTADLMEAVAILKRLNESGGRKVPEGAPTSFVPTRYAEYLAKARKDGDETAYRHYWELCVVLALRDGLRSGDIFVPGSRRYADPATYLYTPEQWAPRRADFCKLVRKPANAAEAIEQGKEELGAALAQLEQTLAAALPDDTGAVRLDEDDQLVIPPLSAEDVPGEVKELKAELTGMLPFAPIASLLIELDVRTGFLDCFTHAGGRKQARSADLKRNILSVLIANATNLGLARMSEACGIPYDVLRWTQEWYVREETLREANTCLVNHHHGLALSKVFGGGTMSSSDGQRFPVRGKSTTARDMTVHGGQVLSSYTHVSDQHSTFGTKIIVPGAREAHFVLDDFLGNATDLPLFELKEWGMLRRTLHAAKYLSDPAYSRKIARQLNKGESLHALRRDLYYAQQGTVTKPALADQTDQAWCLTVLTNAVITWTTEYYSLAARQLRAAGRDVPDELLAHISPAHSENVNFFGVITVDVEAELDGGGWRPLRPVAAEAMSI